FTIVASTNSTTSAAITTNNSVACPLSAGTNSATVTIIKGAGMCKFTATWPADTNYTASTATQTITLAKASTTLTWATPAPITYGTPIDATQLNATDNVPGKFTYLPAAGKVDPVGSNVLKVTFTPTDTNFATSTATVNLQVTQAATTTSITSPSTT